MTRDEALREAAKVLAEIVIRIEEDRLRDLAKKQEVAA